MASDGAALRENPESLNACAGYLLSTDSPGHSTRIRFGEGTMPKLGYLLFAAIAGASLSAHADEAEDLAKALSNPVAAMISVPFVFNADFGYGPPGNGTGYTLNIQPVIPFTLNPEWNLISRTILPV